MKRRITLAIVAAAMLVQPLAAQSNSQPCPLNEKLPVIPEITRTPGYLRGTVAVDSAQQLIPFRNPTTAPTQTSTYECYSQWVRVLRRGEDKPGVNPMPGPTLRARVGDLVQLTFLNLVDPNVFPYSMDQGEKSFGCDQTSIYPANTGDQFPNCFHGSSTANIHFHGSHTNPNSTGDNVFLEIRPSPRTQDQANAPVVNAATVREPFEEFFARCETVLNTGQLVQWPRVWGDLPAAYTEKQAELLRQYDASGKYKKKLWPVDARQIAEGNFPQYFIGAFPYCWRIPEYKEATWPPAEPAPAPGVSGHDAAHTAGAGTAEVPEPEPARALQMGQSPGTHWYHAHKHGSTAINVSNGMTGAFIMEGKYDDDLNAYYGKDWTRGAKVMVINQLGVSPNLERGGGGTTKPGGKGQQLGPDKGPSFSVNGRIQPYVEMQPGEVQMWRIVNTSSRAGTFLNLPAGFQWKQLAQDGVQFNNVNYQAALNQPILLMPGNRADLLVMAPATITGTSTGKKPPAYMTVPLLVQNVVDPTADLPTAAQVTMLNIRVGGKAKPMQFIPQAPTFPPFLADITDKEVTGKKTITFSTSGKTSNPGFSYHYIDGKQFSGEVGEVILLNTVEEWKVVNATYGPPIAHPFHIHINPFQVTEVFDPNATIPDPNNPGKTLPQYVTDRKNLTTSGQCLLDVGDPETWKPCTSARSAPPSNLIWWDVFPIPSGLTVTDPNDSKVTLAQIPGYFKMRSRFVDYHGYYVIHCHILAHEDRGMMTIVEVAPLRSPYSHH